MWYLNWIYIHFSILIATNLITCEKMFYFKYRIERTSNAFKITLINLQADVDAWSGHSTYDGVLTKSRLHKQVSEYTNSAQLGMKLLLSLSLFLSRKKHVEDNSKFDSFYYCFVTVSEIAVFTEIRLSKCHFYYSFCISLSPCVIIFSPCITWESKFDWNYHSDKVKNY